MALSEAQRRIDGVNQRLDLLFLTPRGGSRSMIATVFAGVYLR